MAYTLVTFERALTGAEIQTQTAYLLTQVAAGTTDGISIGCTRAGLEFLTPGTLRRQTWTTLEAADAYIAFLNTFTPPPTFTQSLVFGDPAEWAETVVSTNGAPQ